MQSDTRFCRAIARVRVRLVTRRPTGRGSPGRRGCRRERTSPRARMPVASVDAEPCMETVPLIYDVGLNNGDDSAYYLKKGFNVVGIDAHPALCELCRERFRDEIAAGRMVVLNVGVGDTPKIGEFYLNATEDPISTFLPNYWQGKDWTKIQIEVRTLSSIVREYGEPYFAKIDVEFHDHLVLLDLLKEGIVPEYIS